MPHSDACALYWFLMQKRSMPTTIYWTIWKLLCVCVSSMNNISVCVCVCVCSALVVYCTKSRRAERYWQKTLLQMEEMESQIRDEIRKGNTHPHTLTQSHTHTRAVVKSTFVESKTSPSPKRFESESRPSPKRFESESRPSPKRFESKSKSKSK